MGGKGYNISMKKIFVLFTVLSGVLFAPPLVYGALPTPAPLGLTAPLLTASQAGDLTATDSAVASMSSGIKLVEKKSDLTETRGEVKGRLERYLDQQQLGPLGVTNFLRYAMRYAVSQGVPANTIVLVLLFPLIAMIVAAARHLIGLRGFGIYIPVVLSVAFVATGVVTGIVLFLVILAIGTYGMKLIRHLRMQYLPRMALMLWLVSLGVLATLFIAPVLGATSLLTINIFPILILMLLAENFHEVQMGKSRREATELTIETLILALLSAMLLSLDFVQRFALLNPELLVIGVALINVMVGKYVGLRLTEYLKFRKMTQ